MQLKCYGRVERMSDSVIEWLGRRTHDLRSRVRLLVSTLLGYLFLRQVTVFGGQTVLGIVATT